jgi:Restriction endonuclease
MSGWLDDVLGGYLDSVDEREFDAVFLTLLTASGYTDEHLIHGAFEFGKDFIARKGKLQYAFQTKAGDINLAKWRPIRSQVEEMLWNDIAHPAFDADAERRAVLVTTGRLVGGASADAQQYQTTLAKRVRRRGLWLLRPRQKPPFEVWDRESILALLELNPSMTLNGWGEPPLFELLGLLADANRRRISIRSLERVTRSWVGEDLNRATLATALVGNRLLVTQRPDLAANAACCLLRTAAIASHGTPPETADSAAMFAGRRLFEVYAQNLVDVISPLTEDPERLFGLGNEVIGGATYPVRCFAAIESMGLLGLLRLDEDDRAGGEEIGHQLARFVQNQPGAAHPISDRWALSLVPAAVLLRRIGSDALTPWLESVIIWICDHHYRAPGLASVYAEPVTELRFLLGSPLEHIELSPRKQSYLATVVLDLASVLDLPGLYRDAYNDFASDGIAYPVLEPADEVGQYLFDGTGLLSEANVDFDEDHQLSDGWQSAIHHRRAPDTYSLQRSNHSWELLAISTILRDRHFLSVTRELSGLGQPAARAADTRSATR